MYMYIFIYMHLKNKNRVATSSLFLLCPLLSNSSKHDGFPFGFPLNYSENGTRIDDFLHQLTGSLNGVSFIQHFARPQFPAHSFRSSSVGRLHCAAEKGGCAGMEG